MNWPERTTRTGAGPHISDDSESWAITMMNASGSQSGTADFTRDPPERHANR